MNNLFVILRVFETVVKVFLNPEKSDQTKSSSKTLNLVYSKM